MTSAFARAGRLWVERGLVDASSEILYLHIFSLAAFASSFPRFAAGGGHRSPQKKESVAYQPIGSEPQRATDLRSFESTRTFRAFKSRK